MKAIANAFPLLGTGLPREERPPAVRAPPQELPTPPPATPAPPEDHERLCSAALRGDPGAWNALVQKHNHRVVVALLARGVRSDRAKDLAQEAWIRLIEQQRNGRLLRLQLPGLAIAQASFLALESARREASSLRHEAQDGAEMAVAAIDPQADAEERLLTEERVARAVEVLSTCSPSARKVFRLAYGGDGLSHADVASRVGLSLQRVRQILCEVRAKLRSELEGAEDE
jgi:RNA polymerase sigma-70 factor (ECF subfamily)